MQNNNGQIDEKITLSCDEILTILKNTYERGWRDGFRLKLLSPDPEVLLESIAAKKPAAEANG